MAKAILIKQKKSMAQVSGIQRATIKALGLRGIGTSIFRSDTRALRGMLNKVQHLISAEQVERSKTNRPAAKKTPKGYKVG